MKSFAVVSVKKLVLITFVLLAVPTLARAGDLPDNIADLVDRMGPSVVNIYSTKLVKTQQGQGLSPFHNDQEIPELFKKFFDLPD